MTRVYVFIDAAYVRQCLTELGYDWSTVRLAGLATLACRAVSPQDPWIPTRVLVYDAVPGEGNGTVENDVARWLSHNARQPDTHVRRGRLAGERRRQKRVDVQLAVDAVTGAYRQLFDVAVLITGDDDFSPVVEAVRESGPTACVAVFDRPQSNSSDLQTEADRAGTILLSSDIVAAIALSPA